MSKKLVLLVGLVSLLGVRPVAVRAAAADYPHGTFEADCTQCHTTEAWRPVDPDAEFDHDTTGFLLRGMHEQVPCTACHASLRFAETNPDCVSCHLDVHRSELGIDCAECHSTRSFIDRFVMQRRHVATRLPLRGTHLATDCNDCHAPAPQGRNQYVNTPVECDACHLDAYLRTMDPDHQADGFSTDCQPCHAPTTWSQGRFNHATATGSCESCHLDDYLGTNDPNHQAEGFPTSCELCHNTNNWDDATFVNHDALYFPIFLGRHRNLWSDCSDCHVSPSNFSVFSCLTCHPHDDQNGTASDHDEVNGYAYQSQACYACHPQGNE